jgi:hypothetical protein
MQTMITVFISVCLHSLTHSSVQCEDTHPPYYTVSTNIMLKASSFLQSCTC